MIKLIQLLLNSLGLITLVTSHGRLMDPPSRSALWRFPEFAAYNPPQNFNDNELFCGGFDVQYKVNGGNCGPCGDPWDQPVPRDNEDGGLYGRGIITRNYTVGQLFVVDVELTSSHWGHWEIRLCPWEPVTQECFDAHVLQFAHSGQTYFRVEGDGEELVTISSSSQSHRQSRAAPKYYSVAVYLPWDIRCEKCVLQWYYHTGSRWGQCGDGSHRKGCGPQETFVNCADISIS